MTRSGGGSKENRATKAMEAEVSGEAEKRMKAEERADEWSE